MEIQNQEQADHEQKNPIPTFQLEFFRVPPQIGMSVWEDLGHLSKDLLCGCEQCAFSTLAWRADRWLQPPSTTYTAKVPEAILGNLPQGKTKFTNKYSNTLY